MNLAVLLFYSIVFFIISTFIAWIFVVIYIGSFHYYLTTKEMEKSSDLTKILTYLSWQKDDFRNILVFYKLLFRNEDLGDETSRKYLNTIRYLVKIFLSMVICLLGSVFLLVFLGQ
jgi:hypothetical protein